MTSPTLEAPGLARAERAAALPRRRLASFPAVLESNPYQQLLYGQLAGHGFDVEPGAEFRLRWLRRRRGDVEILHFHWPHGYWRVSSRRRLSGRVADWAYLLLFGARLAAARALGYRVAWTIHQVYSHEHAPSRLDRVGAEMLARASGVLLAHDETTALRAREVLGRPARKIAIVPHGSYVGVYEAGRSREQVRRELGLTEEQTVFLHLGDLRAYKDIERLLEAFRSADLPSAALVVAGSAKAGESAEAVRAAAQADARIVSLLEFVPKDRVAELFDAADVAVIARSDGGTSGSLILALSLGKPVVAAACPAYRTLLGRDAAGWQFEPGSVESLAEAIRQAATASPADRAARGRAALARAKSLDWEEIGRRTAELLAGRRRKAA